VTKPAAANMSSLDSLVRSYKCFATGSSKQKPAVAIVKSSAFDTPLETRLILDTRLVLQVLQ